jgi:ketosteroid isomerase-like protein
MSAKTDFRSANGEHCHVVRRFNEAFGRHDVPAVMALMTDDCVFDNTRPPPDGERCEGQKAVRAFWEQFFARSPEARFDAEEIFASGDRCVARWSTAGPAKARAGTSVAWTSSGSEVTKCPRSCRT